MSSDTGKTIMLIGAVLIAAGLVIHFFHNRLNWIGNLPGDIRISKENFRFYFPVTTMLLFSLLITLLIRLWRWLM